LRWLKYPVRRNNIGRRAFFASKGQGTPEGALPCHDICIIGNTSAFYADYIGSNPVYQNAKSPSPTN
jgi:hypothetical protein